MLFRSAILAGTCLSIFLFPSLPHYSRGQLASQFHLALRMPRGSNPLLVCSIFPFTEKSSGERYYRTALTCSKDRAISSCRAGMSSLAPVHDRMPAVTARFDLFPKIIFHRTLLLQHFLYIFQVILINLKFVVQQCVAYYVRRFLVDALCQELQHDALSVGKLLQVRFSV